MKIVIVGAGVAGLTLALLLEKRGLRPQLFEAADAIMPLGLGINLLPHATQVLDEIGVLDELAARGVTTREAGFYNRFGQHIYTEPLGRVAGYAHPQLSMHRADLHEVLLAAYVARLGADRLHLGHRCAGVDQSDDSASVRFDSPATGRALASQTADVVIAADGIHSVIRKQLHPEEGDPVYSGVNMWRGASVGPPYLSGATMIRAGWLATGKMVIYPIRNHVDAQGNQLINWVAEIETDHYKARRDWNRPGRIEDFIGHFDGMAFDWLDIPAMIRRSERILEFPMVDQNPLESWTQGRVTLIGDAAHPMVPRGSNGAGQAILDAKCLADRLAAAHDPRDALSAYEAERLPATTKVVLTNRTTPPDAILKIVYERTGDQPFERIEDVVQPDELRAVTSNYKTVAGYDHVQLKGR